MSISSQVLIGYYIKAKCTPAQQVDSVMACTSDNRHEITSPAPNFCPTCGSKVEPTLHTWEIKRSLFGIQWEGAEYDWIQKLSPEDLSWINENFSVADTAYVDGEEGYDYIMCGHYQSIDGLTDAVIPMSVLELTMRPRVEDIERLQALMQYESAELLFGALVSVSS